MPGLLRGTARSAVIAGTATAVHNRVSRRQAERWQRQGTCPYDQPQPAYEEPAPQLDRIQQLKDLAGLKTRASSPRRSSPPRTPASWASEPEAVVA